MNVLLCPVGVVRDQSLVLLETQIPEQPIGGPLELATLQPLRATSQS